MKLNRKAPDLLPTRMRIDIPGTLKAELDDYARHYEEKYGEAIDTEALILEMLRAFLNSDRTFRSWQRAQTAGARP